MGRLQHFFEQLFFCAPNKLDVLVLSVSEHTVVLMT